MLIYLIHSLLDTSTPLNSKSYYCVLFTGPSRFGRFFVLFCIASKVLSSVSISPRSALTCLDR